MENPFKSLGLRQFIIKTAIFLLIGFLTVWILQLAFTNTELFKQFLQIPKDFYPYEGTSRVILINALLFGAFAFFVANRFKLKELKTFRVRKRDILVFGGLAVFFLVFHYYFKYLISKNLETALNYVLLLGTLKIMISVLFLVFLAFAVYGLPFLIYFTKKFKKQLMLFTGIGVGFYFVMQAFQNLWLVFSSFISKLLFWVFSLFYKDVVYNPFVANAAMEEGGGPLLGINGFNAIIGKPCSGIDSLLLFTALYILIFLLDYKRLKKPLAITLFFVGAVGMFATNILRVFILYLIGAYISPQFAAGLFHTNIGWILFIVYFIIFWFIASKFVYKKEKINSS